MKPPEFFERLEDLCDLLGIEDHDREVLQNFRDAYLPEFVQQQVSYVNQALWSSYLVWDAIQQDFRLYKGADHD